MPEKNNIKNIYSLSPMQEGMLFHAVMGEHPGAYIEQTVITLRGPIDPERFKRAYQFLVDRTDILRTVFVYRTTKRPRQVVLEKQTAEFTFTDQTSSPDPLTIENFLANDRDKGFDLTKGPLMRLHLVQTGDKSWQLVWSFHHILMDGWCLGILFREFMDIYHAMQAQTLPRLQPVVPYSRYIQWLEKQDKPKGLTYWKEYIDGYEQPATLPRSRCGSSDRPSYVSGNHKFQLDDTQTRQLRQIAMKNRVTENVLFQALWGIMLQRYTSIDDVIFGAVVSGRPAELDGSDRMVGLFINTVPIRIQSKDGQTFSDLLKTIQYQSALSKPFEHLPLADIQAMSPLKNRLIDQIIAFENYPLAENIKQSQDQHRGMEISAESIVMHEQTNYDLNLLVIPSSQLTVHFMFNSAVYDPAFIRRITDQLDQLIRQVIEHPDIRLNDIDILTPDEKQELLIDLNQTATDWPKDKTIQQLFEEQVAKTPDRIAITDAPIHLSYRELNENAGRLAGELQQRNVGEDSIVAIMMERSIDMFIGLLGILKAGGAYLPIDPSFPKDRVEYMLKDSGAALLVTTLNEEDKKSRSWEGKNALSLTHLNLLPSHPLNFNPLPSTSLAYLIYTSGSTGKPKGVMMMHYSATRVIKNANYFAIKTEDRILQLSNYAFDGSIFEIFGSLLEGAVLALSGKEAISSLDKLTERIKRENITIFFTTTALFNAMVDIDIHCFRHIRGVLYGGERISVPHARKALDYMGPGRIIHLYGPTETGVYSTFYPIDSIDEHAETIPIGKPISNTTVYILNRAGYPVPVGAPGELYIGGGGLARGYLNNPELTAEKFNKSFWPHLFSKRWAAEGMLYKTGDIVKWVNDGNIEFIERVDNQVKIRGFRIEIGEIENRILAHEAIKEAIVIARPYQTGEKYLCAYFSSHKRVEIEEIKTYLSTFLPDHMIPSYFIQVEKLPIKSTGKVDIRSLPSPETDTAIKKEYVAPRNEIEHQLVEIWSELLERDPSHSTPIGIDDNFFDIGGHSLKAAGLVSIIHKKMNIKIPLSMIFQSPTIRLLAWYIENINETLSNNQQPDGETESSILI
ncbi:MAG: amino acid adenylation domain-containing protein [Candidatus Omnitrophota bacterium]